MLIKQSMFIIMIILLAVSSYGVLDIYLNSYNETSKAAGIVVVNRGNISYHNIEIKVDERQSERLIGELAPGLGVTYKTNLFVGTHKYFINTTDNYTYMKEIIITPVAGSAADISLGERKQWMDEQDRYEERKRAAREKNQGENIPVTFKDSEPALINDIMIYWVIISIALLTAMIAIIYFIWIKKK